MQTKFLVPQYSSERLPRPRLLASLKNASAKRLVLISAPAGFGKTTLLSAFAQKNPEHIGWYQLDTSDNDPSIFLGYLVQALRRIHQQKNFGEATLTLLENPEENQVEYQQILTVLINELFETTEESLTIILEDYHQITNPLLHQLLDYLLENAPPNFQIILSTRVDPPLKLARLRVRGVLAELRATDLRFNTLELKDWLEQQTSGITDESIQALNEKTEGWAAAIQIVVSSVQGQPPEQANKFIAQLAGNHRFIFDYLTEEVFQRLSEHQQDFLIKTSVFEQMNVEASNFLLDRQDAFETLQSLEHANLFLTSISEERKWYRYHQLFREFLLAKLRREYHADLLTFEHRAGDYYASLREWDIAFTHYIAANSHQKAANMLENFAPGFVEHGRVEALNRYLNKLNETILQKHPELLLQRGNVLRRLGEAGAAFVNYEDARFAFKRYGNHAGVCRALTRLAEMNYSQGHYRQTEALASTALAQATSDDHAERARALMALAKSVGFLTGMDEGRKLAEQAVEEARHAGQMVPPHVKAALLQSLGQICWWHGDPQAAVRYCQEALLTIAEKLSPIAAKAAITMVTPYLYWRDLETALKYAERGLEIAQTLHLVELLPSAYAALGNVLTRLGETARAEGALRQAMETAQRLGLASYARVMATGYLAYNLSGQGRVEEAKQLAEGALWSYTGNPDTYEVYVCRSVLADVALETNQLDEAETLFAELLQTGLKHQFRIPLAMVHFGLAYIYLTTNRTPEGIAQAQKSLALIEASRAMQLYLDQGERCRVVCEALIKHGDSSPFIKRVLRNLPEETTQIPKITNINQDIVTVKTMGQFQVFVNGVEISQEQWVSTKARDLLAYFITLREERISVEKVFDALWQDKVSSGRTAFHTALSRLRKALRGETRTLKFILVETGEYWLDSARFGVDVDEFDSALAKARAADNSMAEKWYEYAIGLYQGDYLDNLYYDWVFPERRRLTRTYLSALCTLANTRANRGEHESALELLQKALTTDHLREDVHCQIMKVYAAQKNQSAIIRQYQAMTHTLWEELGVEPMGSTVEIYQALIQQVQQ